MTASNCVLILYYGLLLPFAAAAQTPATASGVLERDAPKRARVVVVNDPEAMVAFEPQPERVLSMVNRSLTLLTLKKTPVDAWLSLVSTQDVVGLKVFSMPGAIGGTRPAVAAAVAQGLLAAGLQGSNVIIWDKRLANLRGAGFVKLAQDLGISVAGCEDEGYDDKVFYESPLMGQLVWGDHEFGQKGDGIGRKSFVSKLVSKQLTKIINIMPLLNHNHAGVTGNLYGLAFGSIDNTMRFESNPKSLAAAVPEIYALQVIGDRVVLNIVDALIGQYEGEHSSLLHYSAVLNQLRVSTDPVALDVLSIRELDALRQRAKIAGEKLNLDLYKNAALLELGIADERRIQVEQNR